MIASARDPVPTRKSAAMRIEIRLGDERSVSSHLFIVNYRISTIVGLGPSPSFTPAAGEYSKLVRLPKVSNILSPTPRSFQFLSASTADGHRYASWRVHKDENHF